MDARHHHSAAAAAAADTMQVDQAVNEITMQDVNRNDDGMMVAINDEPGTIHVVTVDNICPQLSTREVATLARSSRFFHSICQPQLDKLALQALYQAIIDDDRKLARRILNSNPRLLLEAVPANLVIESKLTWQKFKLGANDTPLAIAAKRKQIEMIKLLLPYYDQLAQDNQLNEESRQYASAAREAGLKAWSFYTMTKNAENQDEIVIPTEYSSVINNLIDVFRSETFATKPRLSDNTESAMRSLLDLLVPKSAIELDNHIDVELLLLAAYQLYNNRFNDFTRWKQRNAFCIRVMGLIQSALSPETAKIFCEDLCHVVERNQQIGLRAAAFELHGGASFYRESRESLSGLAGKYLCAPHAGVRYESLEDWVLAIGLIHYKAYVQQKHQICRVYAATAAAVRAIDRVYNLLK